MEWANQVSETNWAYLAGMTDGEGYVNIYLHGTQNYDKSIKRGYFREYKFEIASADKELLLEIKRRVGNRGAIVYHKRAAHDSPRWHGHYTIRWYPNELRIILPKVTPYLILKKKLSQLMLESLSLKELVKSKEEREIKYYEIDIAFDEERKKTSLKLGTNSKHDARIQIERNALLKIQEQM